MRQIKLTGREVSVVRAMGFAEAVLGGEIQEGSHMDAEDVADTLNSLISAGYVTTIPFAEEVPLAEMATFQFEVNPAYAHDLKRALVRRF